MNRNDESFAYVAGLLLHQSQRLSYIILAITLTTCILFLWSTRTLGLPLMFHGSMGTTALVMAWGNRRAIVDLPRFLDTLRDRRLKSERGTVVLMAAADMIAFVVSLATGIRLIANVFLGT